MTDRKYPPTQSVTEAREGHFRMTLKELRALVERTADIPDDTPIFYQRIEDQYFEQNNWHVTMLPWEPVHHIPKAGDAPYDQQWVDRHFETRIVDGKEVHYELNECIAAFCGIHVKDKDGNSAILFNAHY